MHMIEHLNAEIVLETITDIEVAIQVRTLKLWQ